MHTILETAEAELSNLTVIERNVRESPIHEKRDQ